MTACLRGWPPIMLGGVAASDIVSALAFDRTDSPHRASEGIGPDSITIRRAVEAQPYPLPGVALAYNPWTFIRRSRTWLSWSVAETIPTRRSRAGRSCRMG